MIFLGFEKRQDPPEGNPGGIVHFRFRLKNSKDIHVIVNSIIDAGAAIMEQGDFMKGCPHVFFFKDPNGYEVEVGHELLP